MMKSPDVHLRSVQSSDLDAFYEHQSDEIASALAVCRSPERADFVRHWTAILADPDVSVRTVEHAAVPIGYVAAFERDGEWRIAYWLAREHWGKGLGTKALCRFLGVLPHRPLTAFVAASNRPSLRVLAKCGFVEQCRVLGEDRVEEVVLELRQPTGADQPCFLRPVPLIA